MYYTLMEGFEHNVNKLIKLLECLLTYEHLLAYGRMTVYEMYDRALWGDRQK